MAPESSTRPKGMALGDQFKEFLHQETSGAIVLLATWLAVRIGIADLPAGVGWRHVVGAGALAGVGFTMSLFVANLAFDTAAESAQAKSAIFVASIVAGLLGYAALRFWAPPAQNGRE